MPPKSETIEAGSAQGARVAASPVWEEFPEFLRFKEEAASKYVGWLGHSLTIPGCEELIGRISAEDLFIISSTNDMWECGDGIYWNTRANQFARRHNEWLRQIRAG